MILIGIFLGVLLLTAQETGPAAWVLAVLAAGGYYLWDVRRRPMVACRVCSGDGTEKSRIGGGKWFRRPFADCWCCGGAKYHPRLALRVLNPGKYRRIRDEIKQEVQKVREAR